MRYVVGDFETASRCDLTKRGAWVYAGDFSTFLMTWAQKVVEDQRPRPTRVLGEHDIARIDKELLTLASDPSVMFVAHNAAFEQGMWAFHMVPLGYPPLGPERWHDTMAVAAMKGLPLGLDALGRALELPVRKDEDGHRLMLRMCKPNLKGEWEHSADNIARLKQYNVVDVDTQYSAHSVLGGLGASERETWLLDQKINQRGILIDKEFVGACIAVLDQVRDPMTERFKSLTGLKPTQREKVLNWVNAQGVALGDVKKATLDAILDPDDEFDLGDFSEPLPFHVHEALTLRRSLASSSVAKLERMLGCAGADGRVRYSMQYHGARTGRWAGRLIQIQNYPRGEIKDRSKKNKDLTAESLADAILTRDVKTVEDLWGDNDIFSAVISSLRSCIIPAKGNVLVGGDYAAVEARILLAMAGQHDRLEMMHAGVDMYNEMGSMIFKRPIDRKVDQREGHIAKGTFLGSGYGLGPVGLRARFIPKEDISVAMLAINAYRNEMAPNVPKFWYGLYEESAKAVWCERFLTYTFAGIEFRKEGDFLTMRLPSGRKIYYHRPRPEKNFNPRTNKEYPAWSFMSYQGKKFRRLPSWYGQLTADCIQGTARDLIVHALKTCDKEGLNVIFSAHDEGVLEEPERPGLALMLKQIMEDIPDWARERKFLISAETETMVRYHK